MWKYLKFFVSILEKSGIRYGSTFHNCRSRVYDRGKFAAKSDAWYLFVVTVAPCIEMSIKLLAIHSICQQTGEGCDCIHGCGWECLPQHRGAEET